MDQADTLRKIMEERESHELSSAHAPAASVITIASGKGGVGKSVISANLGVMLARQGYRVLLIDSDFGLANLDTILGVQTQATLEDALFENAHVNEVVVGIEPNLWLLPSASGLSDARSWDGPARRKLARLFENCPWEMDFIIVDAGSGIGDNVLTLHQPTQKSVIVVTPEPTSITDAYGLMKLIRKTRGVHEFQVLVNEVSDGREGWKTFQRLKEVCQKFLDIDLFYLGHLNRDPKVNQAVMNRKNLLDLDREAPFVVCMELLAKRLKTTCLPIGNHESNDSSTERFKDEPALNAPLKTAGFWRSLLGEVKA